MLEIGSLVDGKYKILNKVGQGGMSIVYLAMNEKANKQWAVKEVRKDGIKDFEVVEKKVLRVPEQIVGIVKCANPKCITNHQPITTKFETTFENGELKLHCHYCEKNTSSENIKIITEN